MVVENPFQGRAQAYQAGLEPVSINRAMPRSNAQVAAMAAIMAQLMQQISRLRYWFLRWFYGRFFMRSPSAPCVSLHWSPSATRHAGLRRIAGGSRLLAYFSDRRILVSLI